MLNRWSKINYSVSGFCCLFSPKQVSKVGKSHTKLSEKNNVFHLPGQILFMTELGNGAAITQSLFSFTTQATGFLCANSSLHISVPFSGKITLTNCLTYSKRDCFHIWNCQGWIFSPWSFLNHDLCWGCQCHSISSGGCGAPWGKAGAAPAGSSQFQPVPAGSSRFQPVPAGHSQIQLVPASSSQTQLFPARSSCIHGWATAGRSTLENTGEEGQNMEIVLRSVGEKVWEHGKKRKGRVCSRSRDPPAAWGEDHKDHIRAGTSSAIHGEPLRWSKQMFPRGTAAWGELMQEQVHPEGLQLVRRSGCSGLTTHLYWAW